MNTFVKVKFEDEDIQITAADMKMCAVTVGGIQYTVPESVGGLISRLGEQVEKEQQRRRKDDDDILKFMRNRASYIAYILSGGVKEHVGGNPAFHGENLLKYPADYQVPMADGVEWDDGSTTEDFENVVARRILSALESAPKMRGNMIAKLDGSEIADSTAFQ